MDDTLMLLCKVGVVVAIVWMVISAYVLLRIGMAARNGVRLMVAWYQDWFDSMFEEESEVEASRAQAAKRPEPAPAAPPVREPEPTLQDSRSEFTGAGTQPRLRSGFVRRGRV